MAEQTKEQPKEQTTNGAAATTESQLVTITAEVLTQMARSAAGELVKGQQPMSELARVVAAEAAQTLEKRGPEVAEEAGILNWRYALLGYVTWQVGKRVIKRKAKSAVGRVTKGGTSNGTRVSDGAKANG